MIELECTIAKKSIAVCGSMVGKTNMAPCDLLHTVWPSRTLRFCGFAGKHVGRQRYRGVFRFEASSGAEFTGAAIDFFELFATMIPESESA